jgi:hypothetical protein
MATIAPDVGRQVALDQIRVLENVRALDDTHVQAARRLDQAAGHPRPGRRP